MPKIELDNLTESQQTVVNVILFEGILRGYEEVLDALNHEYALSVAEDPHYSYYVKHVIDLVNEKYQALSKEVNDGEESLSVETVKVSTEDL